MKIAYIKLKCFGRILSSLRGFVPNTRNERVFIHIYSFKNNCALSHTNNHGHNLGEQQDSR